MDVSITIQHFIQDSLQNNRAQNDGKKSNAEDTYIFVVGALSKHADEIQESKVQQRKQFCACDFLIIYFILTHSSAFNYRLGWIRLGMGWF